MKSFSSYHPAALLGYFAALILIAMLTANPVLQLIALFGGILFSCTLNSAAENIKNMLFYLAALVLIALFNPLFSHNGETVLFYLNSNPVTLEAAACGAGMALTLIAVLIWCMAFSSIMTSDKFIFLFAKTLPKTGLALSMALRFIPLYRRQIKKISRAQKSCGLYSSASRLDRIKSALSVLSCVITWSFENALKTSQSMAARGYALKGKSRFSRFRFTFRDAWLLILTLTLFGTAAAFSAAGALDFSYYPKISAVNMSPGALCAYAAYLALSLLPFFNEVKENLKWKYYESKI